MAIACSSAARWIAGIDQLRLALSNCNCACATSERANHPSVVTILGELYDRSYASTASSSSVSLGVQRTQAAIVGGELERAS